MYANLSSHEIEGFKALSSLLVAPRELKCTASALMNNFRLTLVLYGTKLLSTRLMGSSGDPSKRTNLERLKGSSEGPSIRMNLESQRAIVDSGADLHIWNLKLFSDLQISTLDIVTVNEKATRADRQGTLVVSPPRDLRLSRVECRGRHLVENRLGTYEAR